jgi:hypothetical protein
MEHVGVIFQPDSVGCLNILYLDPAWLPDRDRELRQADPPSQVVVLLPPLKQDEDTKKKATLAPLWGVIKPEESTMRVLSTKVSPVLVSSRLVSSRCQESESRVCWKRRLTRIPV